MFLCFADEPLDVKPDLKLKDDEEESFASVSTSSEEEGITFIVFLFITLFVICLAIGKTSSSTLDIGGARISHCSKTIGI